MSRDSAAAFRPRSLFPSAFFCFPYTLCSTHSLSPLSSSALSSRLSLFTIDIFEPIACHTDRDNECKTLGGFIRAPDSFIPAYNKCQAFCPLLGSLIPFPLPLKASFFPISPYLPPTYLTSFGGDPQSSARVSDRNISYPKHWH